MKQPCILIVDDDPQNFEVIETLLSIGVSKDLPLEADALGEHQDYQLYYAASGQEAIEFLDIFRPDLILLDVMMPGIGGIEVCRRIKAMPKWQAVPIIIVTALSTKSDLAKCIAAGANDFISKPISAIELRARVHSMLRIKQQYDNIQTLSRIQNNTINILESTLSELHGNLASNLAHELNTPLNGIVGTVSFLKSYLENMDTSEVREMLDLVDRSARRLENLTQKFRVYLELELSASQLSTSQQPRFISNQTRFSSSTIESELKTYAYKCDRGNDLVLELEEANLALSERHLSIIFRELVENALKFSSPASIVKVTSQVAGDMLNLSVHDSGRGMTEAQIAKVGPFMQFEREVHEQQGVGMGLKLVKKIVKLAGGQFWINSVYQQETTVNIALPIVRN